jgi:ubiquinone/menaquinone biosynthesis C-methylase UbiE
MPKDHSTILSRFLHWFFSLLYHPFAWTYDWVAILVSLGRWKNWGKASLDYVLGNRILELGFGPGHIQVELAARGKQVFGLDESRQMTIQAFKQLKKTGAVPRLVRGVSQVLPFPDGEFHTVLATFPTEFIFSQTTLSEIQRVLCPGGRLVVLISAWITGMSLPEATLRNLYCWTGQVPKTTNLQNILIPFQQTGFNPEMKWIALQNSRLLVILADKPGQNQF